jgi:hypothetical protein
VEFLPVAEVLRSAAAAGLLDSVAGQVAQQVEMTAAMRESDPPGNI